MISTVISIVIVLFVATLVWGPLFSPLILAEASTTNDETFAELSAERERVFLLLEEIEGDFRGGKLSAEDHANLRAPLVSRAREIIEQLKVR